MPCGNPHFSYQTNHMLTCVIILANTYAPIRVCHIIIFLHLTHETLTLIFLLSYNHHGSRRSLFTDLAISRATTTDLHLNHLVNLQHPKMRVPPTTTLHAQHLHFLAGHHLCSRPRVLLPHAPAMAAPSNRQLQQHRSPLSLAPQLHHLQPSAQSCEHTTSLKPTRSAPSPSAPSILAT